MIPRECPEKSTPQKDRGNSITSNILRICDAYGNETGCSLFILKVWRNERLHGFIHMVSILVSFGAPGSDEGLSAPIIRCA